MASRILRSLLAPAAFAAVLGQESCLEDDVSLMQVAALTGKAGAKASHAHAQVPAPQVSSMTDNTGFLCIEGSPEGIPMFVALTRATPLAGFDSHVPHMPVSCAARGYTQALGADMCNGAIAQSTVWARPSTTPDALQAFSNFVREGFMSNGRMRKLAPELVEKWVVCLVCNGGVEGEGYRWLGTNTTYSLDECGWPQYLNVLDEVQAAILATYSRVGSFVPDTGVVCFEGPYQYMVDSLAATQNTPYRDLFGGHVQEATCAQRGYSKFRDPVDDCWPLATKNIRPETESADIAEWVAGDRGFMNTLRNSDTSRGLPTGLSANLVSCFACQAGSWARDRGMLLLNDPGASNGGYTAEQCRHFLEDACVNYPTSGAVTPALCEQGLTNFNWAFREMPFEPVPTL